MTKVARKQVKAVEKIRKAIRKAVDKGVSAKVVAATVERAMSKVNDDVAADLDDGATPKVMKVPGLHKQSDITLKRGVTYSEAKPASNTDAISKTSLLPDPKKPNKKFPGKRKPPALAREKKS